MAKVGNEAKLILRLATERMLAKQLDWEARSSNPNSNSNCKDWRDGWKYADDEWRATLIDVVLELELK